MAGSPNRTQLWLNVIGTVVAVLTILLSVAFYVEDRRTQFVNRRIDVLEHQTNKQFENVRGRMDRIEARNWEMFRNIGEDLRQLNIPPQFSEPPP